MYIESDKNNYIFKTVCAFQFFGEFSLKGVHFYSCGTIVIVKRICRVSSNKHILYLYTKETK